MTDKKIWFVTGAARGMGVDIAKAALAAGNAVVATARNADTVTAALGEHDDLLAVRARHHRPRLRRGGRRRCGRAVRADRRAGQQRRQLLRRLLRRDQPGPDASPDRDQPVRPDERHPRGAAGDAPAAVRARRHDLLDGRADRPGVRRRVRGEQVRRRGLDGVAALRRRAVRHPHHHRRARLLPHRAARRGLLDDLARAVDRRLRRPHRRRRSRRGAA